MLWVLTAGPLVPSPLLSRPLAWLWVAQGPHTQGVHSDLRRLPPFAQHSGGDCDQRGSGKLGNLNRSVWLQGAVGVEMEPGPSSLSVMTDADRAVASGRAEADGVGDVGSLDNCPCPGVSLYAQRFQHFLEIKEIQMSL